MGKIKKIEIKSVYYPLKKSTYYKYKSRQTQTNSVNFTKNAVSIL